MVHVAAERGLAKHAPLVRRLARATLRELGEDGAELSIALVGDEEMRRLNCSFRGKDRTTDVLSFAQREGEGGPLGAQGVPALLGDVVISVPTAERQAAERGHALERELAELVVHGILHLLGWDHERSPAEARRMFAKQRQIVQAIAGPMHGTAEARAGGRTPARRRTRSAGR